MALPIRIRILSTWQKKILLLEKESLRKEMGKIGMGKIKNKYSWDYLAEEKIKDFEKIKKI